MELVGNYVRVVEENGVVLMDFQCTNKEIFKDILVPPILKHEHMHILGDLLRIFVGRNREEGRVGIQDQWVLRHVEEL